MPRLFHFSEDDAIATFEPRPVRVPSSRPSGMEWLNGPLVWAIDEWHQPMYLFPRECPRILLWATDASSTADIEKYMGTSTAPIVAYLERGWMDTLQSQTLYRYEFAQAGFRSLNDAGMWVASKRVVPIARQTISDLPDRLARCGVELRVLESLVPLRDAWSSSLHVSGIRLRNAAGWSA